MLTVEELLRPRYKVIADFPGCSYEVGTVLYVDPSGELYSPVAGYSRTATKAMECDIDKYKANFQPLPWWSDREISDMPEYVNCPSRKMFFRVERWHKSYFVIDGKQKMQYGNYIPATLADYEQYLQQKG